jgi:hypothetical protein
VVVSLSKTVLEAELTDNRQGFHVRLHQGYPCQSYMNEKGRQDCIGIRGYHGLSAKDNYMKPLLLICTVQLYSKMTMLTTNHLAHFGRAVAVRQVSYAYQRLGEVHASVSIHALVT